MCLRGVERRHEVKKSGVAMRINEIGKNSSGRKNVGTSDRCVAFSYPLYKRGALTIHTQVNHSSDTEMSKTLAQLNIHT